MKKINYTLLLLAFLFTNHKGFSIVNTAIQWQKTIGGNNDDVVISIENTSDGGYILGGYSNSGISGNKTQASKGGYDYWVVKTDEVGAIVWQKTIGGTGDDHLRIVHQTKDGGYILGGYSSSGISGDKTQASRGGEDFWIVKLNDTGTIVWQKTIGGSGTEQLYALTLEPDSGFVIGGASSSGVSGEKTDSSRGGSDYWVVKLNSTGNIIWQKTVGGNHDDVMYSVVPVPGGGYILGGQTLSDSTGDKNERSQGNFDYWVVKLDDAHNIVWQNTIGGDNEDHLISTYPTRDKGYILGGSSYSSKSGDKDTASYNGNADLWLVKLDSTGLIKWQKTISGDLWDQVYDMAPTPDGGFILGANSVSNAINDKNENVIGGIDFWIVKVSDTGSIQWQNTIGGTGDELLYSIKPTIDGQYILAGQSSSGISGDKTQPSQGGNDYWIVKLVLDPKFITGNIYSDNNTNCIKNAGERGISDFTIRATNGIYTAYTTSIDSGKYSLPVADTGTYTLQLENNLMYPYFLGEPCNDVVHITDTLASKDLALTAQSLCPYNVVNVSSSTLFRRCMDNVFYVSYCNNGSAISFNTYVDVTLDHLLQFGTSSSLYTALPGNVYRFNIGTLDVLECGSLYFTAIPRCDSTIIGQALCVDAHIHPDTICTTPPYAGSYIVATATCLGDSVELKLQNFGSGMTQQKMYKVIEGNVMRIQKNYQLPQNGVVIERFAADSGNTYRITAEREDNFSARLGDPNTSAGIEGCRTDPSSSFSTGFLTQFPNYDGEPFRSLNCNVIIGSFDPNDKVAYPKGYGQQHYIEANTSLEYVINFQNTGTDTAFKVVVIDTISNLLDINSIQLEASSNAYQLERIDTNVVRFTFKNINLVDSFKNESKSHGFIKFRINQKANNPLGSKITNTAGIYFDFNAPIFTNTTYHTIGKDFIQVNLITEVKNNKFSVKNVSVYPNPFRDKTQIFVESAPLKNAVLLLMDVNGRTLKTIRSVTPNRFDVYREDLTSGVYIYKIMQDNETVATGKLMVQ